LENEEEFFLKNKDEAIFYFSTKANKAYTEIAYPKRVFLMFGRETRGLPEELLQKNPETTVRIPMLPNLRSLNLSNSAAIAVYEVLRQKNFESLETIGVPTTFLWE
jgi:tRNA (cytidine/uridine-2'-O-)-methyltransferase